jgi:hypothetical protein
MSDQPTRAFGTPDDPARVGQGRDVVLARDVLGSVGDPGFDAFPGEKPDRDLPRLVQRLAESIRALGLLSVGLGVTSAVFIWPRVRLWGLAATLALSVAAAVVGLGLRPAHRRALRRLPHDPRSYRSFRRTKSHRCQVGLVLAAVMLGSGLLIRQAELAASARRDSPDGRPLPSDLIAGFNRVRASAIPPGQALVYGDLRLRVDSAEIQDQPRGPVLALTLELRNASDVRKLDLETLRDVEVPLIRTSLWDDLANAYDRLDHPRVIARTENGSETALYPGDTLRARLIFEPPVARARTLLLRIPENTFGFPDSTLFELDATALHAAF